MKTKFKIMCGENMVNKHSQGNEQYYGFNNPIEYVPPIGSIIDYMPFDEPNYKNGEGILTSYKVIGIRFYTRETSNYNYKYQECIVQVEKV